MHRPRISIALGADTAVAIMGGVTRTVAVPVDWTLNGNAAEPGLGAAFSELNDSLATALGRSTEGSRVRIVLMPPLCDVRLVPLPPLRPREAEAVIRRDAARHFVGGSIARAVAVMPAAPRGAGSNQADASPVMAAAAPIATLEAARSAAAATGWVVDGFVPAHGAWLAAIDRNRRTGARTHVIIAVVGDAAHVVRRDDEAVTAVRRAPAGWIDEIVAEAGPAPGSFTILAEGSTRDAIVRAMAAAGWSPVDPVQTASAAGFAAQNSGRARLELVPPSLVADRWRRSRAAAVRIALAAAAVLAVAGAVEMWGVRRELAAVQGRRAAIRADVAPLLATRDSIDLLTDRTAAVRELEGTAPRWTRALFDLALLLPADAHLTALRTRGDTLVIEAAGSRAGDAIQALSRAGSLADVRLEGLVERDLEEGATATERFRLSARLTRPLEAARPSIRKPATPVTGSAASRRSP